VSGSGAAAPSIVVARIQLRTAALEGIVHRGDQAALTPAVDACARLGDRGAQLLELAAERRFPGQEGRDGTAQGNERFARIVGMEFVPRDLVRFG
jgi:hypothetical protein